jgi:hypothetical protein
MAPGWTWVVALVVEAVAAPASADPEGASAVSTLASATAARAGWSSMLASGAELAPAVAAGLVLPGAADVMSTRPWSLRPGLAPCALSFDAVGAPGPTRSVALASTAACGAAT